MNQSEISVLKKLIQDLQAQVARQGSKINELQALVDHYHQGVTPIHSVRTHDDDNKKPFRTFYAKNSFERLLSLAAVGSVACIIISRWWGFDQSIMLYCLGLVAFIVGLRAQESMLVASACCVWVYATLYSFYIMFFYPEMILLSPLLFYVAVGTGLLAFIIAALLTMNYAQGLHKERYMNRIFCGMCVMPLFLILSAPLAEPYVLVGILGYALALFVAGIVYGYKVVRACAYGVSLCFLLVFAHYLIVENFLDPSLFFSFNILCVLAALASAAAYGMVSRYQSNLTLYEQRVVPRVLEGGIVCLLYVWLRAYIIMKLSAVEKPGLILARIWGDYDIPADPVRSAKTNNALAAFYAIYAMIIMCVSFVSHNIWLGHLAMIGLLIASIKFFLVKGTVAGAGLIIALGAIAFFAGMYGYRVVRGRY